MIVNVINNSINELPKYANYGDAGMDLRADFSKGVNTDLFDFADIDTERNVILIFPGGRALIPTNIHIELPKGFEAQIRPRSGLALKNGVTILNTPGTIDCGYRNSIGVILINLGEEVFEVEQGDRICQIVFNKVEEVEWNEISKLSDSERGLTGFGDSGIK